jgi:hypothetical protein
MGAWRGMTRSRTLTVDTQHPRENARGAQLCGGRFPPVASPPPRSETSQTRARRHSRHGSARFNGAYSAGEFMHLSAAAVGVLRKPHPADGSLPASAPRPPDATLPGTGPLLETQAGASDQAYAEVCWCSRHSQDCRVRENAPSGGLGGHPRRPPSHARAGAGSHRAGARAPRPQVHA